MERDKLLRAVRTEREALLAVLDRLDGIDVARWQSKPVGGAWTAKDVLSHLTATDEAVLEVVGQARRGEVLIWPWSGYADGNEWNRDMVAKRAHLSVAEVRAELESTSGALVAELESWPDEAGPFGPDSWDPEKSPIGWLPSHAREHAATIATLVS